MGAQFHDQGERRGTMLRTSFCDLVEIEHPIMQAAIPPATSPELVAAVSNAGGLGSLAAALETVESFRQKLTRLKEMTNRPFAVNHVMPLFNEEMFQLTLDARPAVISLALGDPADLVDRAHRAGAKVLHQVHTVEQARRARELGVDAIIAQGSEAGGQGPVLGVGAMALIPQVVDAVRPLPVLAAGGIADGRGLAAALALGAQGVNIGTRFLATPEASIHETWKQAILTARSEDVVRFEAWSEIMPGGGSGLYDVVPRAIRTPFIDSWRGQASEAARTVETARGEVMTALREGRIHEVVPFTGQSAGLVRDILPASEVVRAMVAEAEQALRNAAGLLA
jgi:nitronate monooxygenase/enoyl-[acyl-carrier protein] reductase II